MLVQLMYMWVMEYLCTTCYCICNLQLYLYVQFLYQRVVNQKPEWFLPHWTVCVRFLFCLKRLWPKREHNIGTGLSYLLLHSLSKHGQVCGDLLSITIQLEWQLMLKQFNHFLYIVPKLIN